VQFLVEVVKCKRTSSDAYLTEIHLSAQFCRDDIKIHFRVWSHWTQLSTDPRMHTHILPWLKILKSVDDLPNGIISSSMALKRHWL